MRLRRPCRPTATTLRGSGGPDATTGKYSPLRHCLQAPDTSDCGAVGGRLHALVGRPVALPTSFCPSVELWRWTARRQGRGSGLRSLPETVRPVLLLINTPVTLLSLLSTFLPAGRPTARASAAGVLRPEPTQAQRDNLTATPLAGHTYRQVYSTQSHDTSARPFRPRRGRRSAACAGWAAHRRLGAFLSERGLRT